MNKYTITSILFIGITFILFAGTIIKNADYIKEQSRNGIEHQQDISYVFTNHLLFSDQFIDIWSTINSVNQNEFTLIEDAEYGNLIKDEKGNLYFPASKVDVEPYVANTYSFSQKAKNFIYFQAPNKILAGYTNPLVSQYNFANENANEFLAGLEKNEVNNYDLRKDILIQNMDYDNLFYRTDHHWQTKTAFWAFQKIVEVLNTKFDCNLDPHYFYRNLQNYQMKEYENCFLGALGRRTGEAIAGLDNYTFIEPKFDTHYTIYNMLSTTPQKALKKGSFRSAITIPEILNSKTVTANKHASYFEWDYGHLKIINENAPSPIKILMIKDSFALPVAAFLSTCVTEIDMVDLRDIPKANLNMIIENNNFDIIMVLYNAEVFNDTMFSF